MEIFLTYDDAVSHAQEDSENIGVLSLEGRKGVPCFTLYSQDKEALQEIAVRSGAEVIPLRTGFFHLTVKEFQSFNNEMTPTFILNLSSDAAVEFAKEL
jgi:hypothetical protein|tara:strand:+ start:4100 stop:4396 length:297 start_codon:yes stop_codon:yes gene_type:complete